MSYVTQRGRIVETRPYALLDQDEREQVLEDDMIIGHKATKAKWNISTQTLHHVRYHNKEAAEEIEEQHFKDRGL